MPKIFQKQKKKYFKIFVTKYFVWRVLKNIQLIIPFEFKH